MPEIQLKPIGSGQTDVPALTVAREMIRWLTQSGQVSVGDKLPSERELTETFRVGRSAVREALKTLSLLGLVEIRPGSGTYLKDRRADFPAQVFEWDILLGQNHGKAMIEARVEVEVILAGLAAARQTEEDLKEIQAALAAGSAAAAAHDIDAEVRSDIAFHLAVAQAAKSSVLSEFLGKVRNLLLVWMRRSIEIKGSYEGTLAEHQRIAEEIANSSVDGATEAMREHMRAAFAVFEPGSLHRTRLDIAATGQEEAQRLVDVTGETSQVGVLEGTEAVYVARVDGTHTLRLISEVGRRLPASCTAIGKAMLSGLTDQEMTARFGDSELPALTEMSITDLGELKRELADVRVTGVALDNCESNEGVRCVAAPVHGPDGDVVAAISVSVPTVRWTPGQEARLTALVIEAGHRMSRTLASPSGPDPALGFLQADASPATPLALDDAVAKLLPDPRTAGSGW